MNYLTFTIKKYYVNISANKFLQNLIDTQNAFFCVSPILLKEKIMKMIGLFLVVVLVFLITSCKEVSTNSDYEEATYVTLLDQPIVQYIPKNVQGVRIATLKLSGDWSDRNYLDLFQVIDKRSQSKISYSTQKVVYDYSKKLGTENVYTLIDVRASFFDTIPEAHYFSIIDLNMNDNVYVYREDIGVAYTTSYRLPHSPTVSLRTFQLSQNSKLGILRVTNVDLDRSIDLSKVTFTIDTQSTARGGLRFSGNLCLRDLGSSASCGGVGTTTAQSVTQAGGTFTVNISGSTLSNALNSLTKNGGFIEYEIYLENAPLWVTGDSVSIGVSSILYDPYNQSEYYIGVAGAQATATK